MGQYLKRYCLTVEYKLFTVNEYPGACRILGKNEFCRLRCQICLLEYCTISVQGACRLILGKQYCRLDIKSAATVL